MTVDVDNGKGAAEAVRAAAGVYLDSRMSADGYVLFDAALDAMILACADVRALVHRLAVDLALSEQHAGWAAASAG